MIEVVNRQRKIKINLRGWSEYAVSASRLIPEAVEKSLTVAFVSDRKIKELNRLYRGADKTTDVLSFASEADEYDDRTDYLGDIVVSLEQAQRQAEENNLELEIEIKQLILHGILHLCGYDHETDFGEMNEKELKLRDKLNIN